MNKIIITLIGLITLIEPVSLIAQEDGIQGIMIDTEISIIFENSAVEKSITANLTFDNDEEIKSLDDFELDLYYKKQDILTKINTSTTNNKGEAVFTLPADITIYMEEDGTINFIVMYKGNNTYNKSESNLSIKDVEMTVRFSLIDSVKSIIADVFEINPSGHKIPVSEMEVYFYTPSLFGLLPIGEGWLEEGECYIDFPVDLPGDESGNINVIAKIIESEYYSNVTSENRSNWAMATTAEESETGKLWTADPPVWMIIALFCLLGAVWSHYYFVYYKMYRIKKAGKKAA